MANSRVVPQMRRVDGDIELTREEIEYLWELEWGAPIPEVMTLQSAAEAVLLQYGSERMQICLNEWRQDETA